MFIHSCSAADGLPRFPRRCPAVSDPWVQWSLVRRSAPSPWHPRALAPSTTPPLPGAPAAGGPLRAALCPAAPLSSKNIPEGSVHPWPRLGGSNRPGDMAPDPTPSTPVIPGLFSEPQQEEEASRQARAPAVCQDLSPVSVSLPGTLAGGGC